MPAKCGEPEFPSNKLQSESFFPSESENEVSAWLDALRESVEDTTIPLSLSTFFQVI